MTTKHIYLCDQNIIGYIKRYNQGAELTADMQNIISFIRNKDRCDITFSFILPPIECDQRNFPNIASVKDYIQKDFESVIEFKKKYLQKAQTDCEFIKDYFKNEIFFQQESNTKDYLTFLESVEPKLAQEISNDKTFSLCKEILKEAKKYNISYQHPVVMTCILIACKHDNIIYNKEKKIKNVIKPGVKFNAYNALQDIMFIVRSLAIKSMFLQVRHNFIKFYIFTADKKLEQLSKIFQWAPPNIPNNALYIPTQIYMSYKQFPKKYFPSLSNEEYNSLQKLITSPPDLNQHTDGT